MHKPRIVVEQPFDKTTVEKQLALGHDPNTLFDAFGKVYLLKAMKANKTDIAEILLKHGADPNFKCNKGLIPLHYAVISKAAESGSIVKRMLDCGADPNIQDDTGSSPLFLATCNPDTDIIKILLEHGGNPNLANEINDTPVIMCARMLNLLVERGDRDDYGLIDLIMQYSIMWNIANSSSGMCNIANIFYHIRRIVPSSIIKNKKISFRKYLLEFGMSCFYEIMKMREDIISNHYTLFNFVYDRFAHRNLIDRDAALLVIDEVILRLKKGQYPQYKDIIFASIKHLLVDRFCELRVFYKVPATSNNITLDSLSINNLAKFLSKDDILNMIFAFCDEFKEHECFFKKKKEKVSVSLKRKKLKRCGEENEDFRLKKPRK